MIFKKICIAYALSLLTSFSFALAADATKAKYEMNWLLAHDPVSLFEEAAKYFAEEVNKNTNGAVKVNILTVSDIGEGQELSPTRVISMVQEGKYEMTQTYTTSLGEYHRDLWVLDLPFIFEDHNHAEKVLDGKIGKNLLAGLSKNNLKGLTFTYSGGFRIIPTSGKAITRYEDLKNLKVRTSKSPVANSMFKFLGAEPVTGSLSAGKEMQGKGIVDGGETTYPRFYSMKQNDVTKIINDTKHSLFLTSIVINQDFYNKLPANYQKIIQVAAIKAGKLERKISIDDGVKTRARAKKEGFKIIELSSKEVNRFKQALSPLYKEQYYPMFGSLIDSIKAEAKKNETKKVVVSK